MEAGGEGGAGWGGEGDRGWREEWGGRGGVGGGGRRGESVGSGWEGLVRCVYMQLGASCEGWVRVAPDRRWWRLAVLECWFQIVGCGNGGESLVPGRMIR